MPKLQQVVEKLVGLNINASSGHLGQGVVDVGKAAFARVGCGVLKDYKVTNSMLRKLSWNTSRCGPMTESAIRALHGAPEKARVSTYTYPAGNEVEGTSKQCTAYVLDGRFTFASDGGIASFEPCDVFEFSGGDYSLQIDQGAQAVVVWAWEFPPGLIRSN
jgi:hypothetical protein